jgi:hypothetical protein
VRNDASAHQNRAEEVDANGRLPERPVDVLDGSHRPVDAGVVHQHVDAAERGERTRDEPLDVLGNRDVGGLADCRAAEFGDSTLDIRGAACADASACAGVDERASNREAEALAASGDDRRSSVENAYARAFPTVR